MKRLQGALKLALVGSALLQVMVACAPLPLEETEPALLPRYPPPRVTAQMLSGPSTTEGRACLARLADMGVNFEPVANQSEGVACHVTDAVVLTTGSTLGDSRFSPANPMMACPLAIDVTRWRREDVEPAAREILGADVTRIDHLGVYACRNVNHQIDGRLSAHAQAMAMDVSGFRLSDGREITVRADWLGDTPAARFLHRIRDQACSVFATTLSPDYNAIHSDHLHLEAGADRFCR